MKKYEHLRPPPCCKEWVKTGERQEGPRLVVEWTCSECSRVVETW